MSRGKVSLFVAAGFAVGCWVLHGLANAQTAKQTQDTLVDAASIDKKLEAILENQQLILKKFDAVMEELRIVKIRCTR